MGIFRYIVVRRSRHVVPKTYFAIERIREIKDLELASVGSFR